MKATFQHIVLLITILINIVAFSQNNEIKGYTIDGDKIVFTFNKDDYAIASHDKYGSIKDFDDLDIENVVVAGNFNNWSRNGWKMKKIDDCHYELRKKIEDFNDEFIWEFKFIINNTYWAEPSENTANITPASDVYGTHLNTFNFKMFTAIPNKEGNTKFFLKGHKDAEEVILSGTFTRWDEDFLKMSPNETGWEITLDLRPGEYYYKFIVDNDWIIDPANPNKVVNEFGGYNSVIDIKELVIFNLKGYQNAKRVILTGTFNNWSEDYYQMNKTEIGWNKKLYLSGGKHHYKYIVDGEWILDPKNPILEYDAEGNVNCVKMVR